MEDRKKEIVLELLDKYLEHEMAKMEQRKEEIEDEWFLYTKCVAVPNLKKMK